MSDVDGIERIRFTTSHPKDLSDKLIEAIRDLPKVCEHIHLAVQSGDDEILARMNRQIRLGAYTGACGGAEVARSRISAITTDFLVGFPGETEEQFDEHYCGWRKRFGSTRRSCSRSIPIPNTAAAGMEDQLIGVGQERATEPADQDPERDHLRDQRRMHREHL